MKFCKEAIKLALLINNLRTKRILSETGKNDYLLFKAL